MHCDFFFHFKRLCFHVPSIEETYYGKLILLFMFYNLKNCKILILLSKHYYSISLKNTIFNYRITTYFILRGYR